MREPDRLFQIHCVYYIYTSQERYCAMYGTSFCVCVCVCVCMCVCVCVCVCVCKVGGGSEASAPFGLVPDSETLNFLSHACNGCVIHPDKVCVGVCVLRMCVHYDVCVFDRCVWCAV